MEYENLKSLTYHQLITPRTLNKISQFLISVSIFSLVYYSKYSSWCCFMFHSLKFYLSAIPFHGLDKRWIFLVCNGILVVLASTSGLVYSPSSGFDLSDNMTMNKIFDDQGQELVLEAAEHTGSNAEADQIEEEEEENDQETDDEEEEEEAAEEEVRKFDEYFKEDHGDNLRLIEEDHEAGKDEETRIYILEDDNAVHTETSFFLEEESLQVEEEQEEEKEEEEEAEHALMEKLSAEELNKKFDDFIRKMKEELRIEAQQQLLVEVK